MINKRKSLGFKNFNDSQAFIEYSNDMDGIYQDIQEYNPNKNRKVLIVFDDLFLDRFSSKKLHAKVTELFIREKKLNIFLVFMTQSYFVVPKSIRLNSTHYLIIKIPNKQELQQIAFNYLSDIDYIDFIRLYELLQKLCWKTMLFSYWCYSSIR